MSAFVPTTQASRLARAEQRLERPDGACFLQRPVPDPPQWLGAALRRRTGPEDVPSAVCLADPACKGLALRDDGRQFAVLTGQLPTMYRDDARTPPSYAFWERVPCDVPGARDRVEPEGEQQQQAAASPAPPPQGRVQGGPYWLDDGLRFSKEAEDSSPWTFDGQLLRAAEDTEQCLAGPSGAPHPEMRPCDPSDAAQRWTNEDSKLCVAGGGACLYASATQSLMEQPPEFNPPVGFVEAAAAAPEEQQEEAPSDAPLDAPLDASTAVYTQQAFLNPFTPMSRRRRLF